MRKVALVTGGAIRVGRALSMGLAAAGFDLVVNYRSSQQAARRLIKDLDGTGARLVLAQGDVSVRSDVEAIAQVVRDEFGRLDLLVNSASTFYSRPLLEIPDEEWDRAMAVNVKGPLMMVQALAPLLRDGGGSVINIVDLSAFRPWTERPHHSVSKAALLHLTKIMARVLAPEVRVNAIAPGTVLAPEGLGDGWLKEEAARTALRTLGTPDDVVRTALFLEASPFITGEVVVVDGGASLGSAEG